MRLIQSPFFLLLGGKILALAAPVAIPTPSPTAIAAFHHKEMKESSTPVKYSEPLADLPTVDDIYQLYYNDEYPDIFGDYEGFIDSSSAEESGPSAGFSTVIKKRQRFEYDNYALDQFNEDEQNFISAEENAPSATISAPVHNAKLFGYQIHPGRAQDEEEQGHVFWEKIRHPIATPVTLRNLQSDYVYEGVGWDEENQRDGFSTEESVLSALTTPTPTPDPSRYTSYGDYGNYGAYGSYGRYGTYMSY